MSITTYEYLNGHYVPELSAAQPPSSANSAQTQATAQAGFLAGYLFMLCQSDEKNPSSATETEIQRVLGLLQTFVNNNGNGTSDIVNPNNPILSIISQIVKDFPAGGKLSDEENAFTTFWTSEPNGDQNQNPAVIFADWLGKNFNPANPSDPNTSFYELMFYCSMAGNAVFAGAESDVDSIFKGGGIYSGATWATDAICAYCAAQTPPIPLDMIASILPPATSSMPNYSAFLTELTAVSKTGWTPPAYPPGQSDEQWYVYFASQLNNLFPTNPTAQGN